MQHGGFGYIPKTSNSHGMLTALQFVLQDDVYIPPKLLGKLDAASLVHEFGVDGSDSTKVLMQHQREVLELIVQGLPYKSIAVNQHPRVFCWHEAATDFG
jgi:DNA-binding NarL/FixJ family response regulator